MFETIGQSFVFVFTIVALSYFLLVNSTYLTLTGMAIGHLRSRRDLDAYEPVGSFTANDFLPGIAIVVPAYNEEHVIVESVSALRSLEYPFYEIIVVNDGSTDGTCEALFEAFELQSIDASYPIDLPCEPIDEIYRSPASDLVLIDKANGGKADALNAGLYFTEQPLYCAIDADSLIERGSLREIVEPFLTEPTKTVATGGSVRIANGVSFAKGKPSTVSLPGNHLVRFQAVEYLRAFFLGRTGLSRIGSLLIISGAFGLFKTSVIREIGGYDTESITEDMELVVRLHRYLIEADRPYEVTFVPHPIVWTEAPSSLDVLSRQRNRWFRGMLGTLLKHRDAIGRPRYGIVGVFGLPMFLIIETIGRLIEGAGYVAIPVFFLAGVLDPVFAIAFLVVAIALGAFVTVLAVTGEVLTYRRYDDPRDIALLLWYSVLESVTYRPWRAFVAWRATLSYVLGDKSWGAMPRTGFGRETKD